MVNHKPIVQENKKVKTNDTGKKTELCKTKQKLS